MQIRPEDYSSRQIYNLMTSCVVPRPIAWVSSISRNGTPNLAPFSYFNAITSKPPLLSVAVGRRRGERKDTAHNASTVREFVVNIVTEPLKAKMIETSVEDPPEVNEIEKCGLTPIPSLLVRPPRIAESPIQLECRTREIFEVSPGIVDLVIGEIVVFHLADHLPLREDLSIPASSIAPQARLGGKEYAGLGAVTEHSRPSR